MLVASLLGAAAPAADAAAEQAPSQGARRAPGVYARVRTTEGSFTFRLLETEAPKTVANFVGLAEGSLDPATGKPAEARPFYDGLTFHRVINGFMIQGGDPKGDGTGGPGYRIGDELARRRTFDRPGLVAMAGDGPNRVGSQFFVTLCPADWLNGKFTIFGEIVDGLDVVRRIAAAKTLMLPGDRPVEPVRIESLRIERVGG